MSALSAVACSPEPSNDVSDGAAIGTVVFTANSPFCSGRTLASCSHPRAEKWRHDLGKWIAKGVPEAEIRSRLQNEARFVALRPGTTRPGWTILIGAIVLSSLWLIVVARTLDRPLPPRRTRPVQHESSATTLDEELASLDYTHGP